MLAGMALHNPALSPTAFLSLSSFQPHLTPYCSLNLLQTLPTQAWPLLVPLSAMFPFHDLLLPHFQVFIKYHLCREIFPDYPV